MKHLINGEVSTDFVKNHEAEVPTHPHIRQYDSITENDRSIIGGKGLNLALMAQQGIVIPEGFHVSTDAHEAFLVGEQVDETLVEHIDNFRTSVGGNIAIRSSATCEDGAELSLAGVFNTYYLDEGEDIGGAISAIYQQSQSEEVTNLLSLHNQHDEVRMGLVVQRLVGADQSGVVYTGLTEDRMLVQYVDGYGNDLVDGVQEGSSVVLNEEGTIVQSKGYRTNPIDEAQLRLLHDTAHTIKEFFGNDKQDIEFAFEEGKLITLQSRPLTTEIHDIELLEMPSETLEAVKAYIGSLATAEKAKLDSEQVIFSDSNFSEILPRPAEMDIGVFSYIFTGSNDIPGAIQLGRSEMGYPLGDESVGFMYYIGGKPYFSVSQDAHTFYAGFPSSRQEYQESLVAEYLARIDEDPGLGEYPEMGLYLQDPTPDELSDRFDEQADAYNDTYLSFKQQLAGHAETFVIDYAQDELPSEIVYIEKMSGIDVDLLNENQLVDFTLGILEHLRTVSCVNFVKSARLGFYYSQRLQSFLQSEFAMTANDAESTFAALSQGLTGSAITDANIEIAAAKSLPDALKIGREKVGHYSTGEMLEIRHVRLKDDEESLKSYIKGIYDNRDKYISEFAKQQEARLALEEKLIGELPEDMQLDFEHILTASQTYMALRETVKYHFVAEYALARDGLKTLEAKLGMESDAIFSVFPRELRDLVSNPGHLDTDIRERRQAFDNYPSISMPPVIREQDINELHLKGTGSGEFLREMVGKLLSQGEIISGGVIVKVDDYENPKEAMAAIESIREQEEKIILVASQMNLSHDQLIMASDGLVIENAGLVSHGAQRARELGRGAIGGIKADGLISGERVVFDPEGRKVTRMSEEQ